MTAEHGHCSEEHGLLLPRQQAVRGGRHGLDVDLGRDTWISWEMPAPGRRLLAQSPEPSPQSLQGAQGPRWSPSRGLPYLADGLREDLDDLLVRCGHHALPVDLDDAVPHTDAAFLCDAPAHQAADLGSRECC